MEKFSDLFLDSFKNKRVLITGGLGFLGSNLAHALVKCGAHVDLLDALLPLYGGNIHNIMDMHSQVAVHNEDIRNKSVIAELVQGQDYVFHFAAQCSHVDSMIDPFLDLDINCNGTLCLLEACRQVNKYVKIVYAGTRGQYGAVEYLPVDEKHPTNPTDVYGVNKHAAEQYGFVYSKAFGLRICSLRVNNTYGPRHQMKHGKYGILNWFIRLALDNKEIPIYGDGHQLRDYNYVDDVVSALLLAARTEASDGQVYNLGGFEELPLVTIAELVVGIAGTGQIKFIPWPEERLKIETWDYKADWTKIHEALGWEPAIRMEEGLSRTIAFYKKHKVYYW